MFVECWKNIPVQLSNGAACAGVMTLWIPVSDCTGSDVAPEDVTIYIKDPKTGAVAGAPVGKLMLLGELTRLA